MFRFSIGACHGMPAWFHPVIMGLGMASRKGSFPTTGEFYRDADLQYEPLRTPVGLVGGLPTVGNMWYIIFSVSPCDGK